MSCEPAAFLLPKVQFSAPMVSGDLCTPALPWGSLPVVDYIRRSHRVQSADGWSINYLRLEDLIAMRLAVGRPKDLRRAAELTTLSGP